jgi:hypothetical protein
MERIQFLVYTKTAAQKNWRVITADSDSGSWRFVAISGLRFVIPVSAEKMSYAHSWKPLRSAKKTTPFFGELPEPPEQAETLAQRN